MIFGITFAVLLSIINAQYKVTLDVIVNGVLQGILCWGVAVGINQTAKQLKKMSDKKVFVMNTLPKLENKNGTLVL